MTRLGSRGEETGAVEIIERVKFSSEIRDSSRVFSARGLRALYSVRVNAHPLRVRQGAFAEQRRKKSGKKERKNRFSLIPVQGEDRGLKAVDGSDVSFPGGA